MCEDRILNNSFLITKIDELINNFESYLLNEYKENLKENHEIFLYFKYTELLNIIFQAEINYFKKNKIKNYFIDCLKKEKIFLTFLKYNPNITNNWIYNTYYDEINKLSKKFLFDIINELQNDSFFTREEFFEKIKKLKQEFKIREKIKEYKEFLNSAKLPKNKKKRNLEKIKEKLKGE